MRRDSGLFKYKYFCGLNVIVVWMFIFCLAAAMGCSGKEAPEATISNESLKAEVRVPDPVISPEAGGHISETDFYVTITCSDTNATIKYTTDDSDPAVSGTASIYTVPFVIPSSKTVKAVATKAGVANSNIIYSSYKLYSKVFLYSTSRNNGNVTGFLVNSNGTLSQICQIAGGGVNSQSIEYHEPTILATATKTVLGVDNFFLYALNSPGLSADDPMVKVFSIDADGILTALPGTTDAGNFSANSMAVRPDSKFLYTGYYSKDVSPYNGITVFEIKDTGILEQKYVLEGFGDYSDRTTTNSIAFDLTGKYMYVTSFRGGKNLNQFLVDELSGQPTQIPSTIGVLETSNTTESHDSIVHPSGKYLYITNNLGVSGFTLSKRNGEISGKINSSPWTYGLNNNNTLSIVNNGKFIIIGYQLCNELRLYAISQYNGDLFFMNSVSSGSSLTKIINSPVGNYIYTSTSSGVNGYSYNTTTGSMTLLSTWGPANFPEDIKFVTVSKIE